MTDGYRPRLTIEITDEQYKKLSSILPWGTQRALFSSIINDIINMAEQGKGTQLVEAIVAGMLKPSDVLKTLKIER